MTKKEIVRMIQEIQDMANDDAESAHILEDNLREDFIKYIAKRKDCLGKKARLILTTNNIILCKMVCIDI